MYIHSPACEYPASANIFFLQQMSVMTSTLNSWVLHCSQRAQFSMCAVGVTLCIWAVVYPGFLEGGADPQGGAYPVYIPFTFLETN